MPDATYLVIGAAGGIGTALCRRLAARGAVLHLAARHRGPLDALADSLRLNGNATTHEVDAADFGAMDALIKSITDAGDLHGVVNLAGSILLKPAHLTSPEDFAEHIQLNIGTAFATVRSAAVAMQRQAAKDGRARSIVLMSTTAAQIGLPNHELIAAAKGAVNGLTRAAAATYASGRVRINAVAPGLINTPLAKAITASAPALEASKSMHPLGRIGEPEDVAPVIEWLLSEESSFTTGQVMAVDGGLSTVRGRAGR